MNKIIKNQSNRRKHALIALSAAIPLIAVLCCVIIFSPDEALSPEEILAKENWSDAELQAALSRSISPAMLSNKRQNVMEHLGKQLKKRSAADRERIRQAAVVDAVTTSLEQLRKMPVRERSSLLKNLEDKAEQNYRTLLQSSKSREKFVRQMQSREAELFVKEVNRVIFAEFTPEERVQFAPVTKLWIKTIKIMEH